MFHMGFSMALKDSYGPLTTGTPVRKTLGKNLLPPALWLKANRMGEGRSVVQGIVLFGTLAHLDALECFCVEIGFRISHKKFGPETGVAPGAVRRGMVPESHALDDVGAKLRISTDIDRIAQTVQFPHRLDQLAQDAAVVLAAEHPMVGRLDLLNLRLGWQVRWLRRKAGVQIDGMHPEF
jgi:hypothetical protein